MAIPAERAFFDELLPTENSLHGILFSCFNYKEVYVWHLDREIFA